MILVSKDVKVVKVDMVSKDAKVFLVQQLLKVQLDHKDAKVSRAILVSKVSKV